MKKLVVLCLLCGAISVNAKTLSVNCQSQDGKSLQMVSEVANATSPQVIKGLLVNGSEVSQFRDISKMPIYQDGNFSMQIQFGKSFYSSADLKLSKCQDDFENNGTAIMKLYVGGFAGALPTNMTCSCSLK
jgi:hypothetical protein